MIGKTNLGGSGGGGSSKGLPVFSYTGSYQLVDDSDAAITDSAYKGNWKIRLLTSGILRFVKLNSAKSGIDVFCVGGGGGAYSGGCGGGGGGYTQTAMLLPIIENEAYEIIIGAGGVSNTKGGDTSAFGVKANGGDYSYGGVGHPGHGGSGGGAYGGYQGGSDGGNGFGSSGGKGQGTTTREFGEPTGKLYAGGGGSGSAAGGDGGGAKGSTNAAANTGGGAGGSSQGSTATHKGGSGIVVIRNARG